MKVLRSFSPCLAVCALLLQSCSTGADVSDQSNDEYFTPVERKSPPRVARHGADAPVAQPAVAKNEEEFRTVVVRMLREHNEQLLKVANQLNMLSLQQENRDRDQISIAGIDSTEGGRERRSAISNQELLELVREQDARLAEISKKLQMLADRQMKFERQDQLAKATPKFQTESVPERMYTYEEAIRLYEGKRFWTAIGAFTQLLKKGIRHDLADNCHFWIGVSYFNLRQYERANAALKAVLRYRDSDKKESTYFMLGQSYELSGARSRAREMYAQMIHEFPHGRLNSLAERKLASLF